MTGPSERPSRPPRENRKATLQRSEAPSRTRSFIRLLYATKIAAALLYAPKPELDAILAALRAEEAAALASERDEGHHKRERRRTARLGWRFAQREATQKRAGMRPRRLKHAVVHPERLVPKL